MKTLAMIKMEKNFIAVIDRKYPRKPYEQFPTNLLHGWLKGELRELKEAIDQGDVEGAKIECGDISNLTDYIFEQLTSKGIVKDTNFVTCPSCEGSGRTHITECETIKCMKCSGKGVVEKQ